MLAEICAEVNNYFVKGIHFGSFEISGGVIEPLDFLQDGQYFRIVGSVFNDGVYQYPNNALKDEEFEGAIWSMAVPPDFLELVSKIKKSCESESVSSSPYTSESFGGYSYTKATNQKGLPVTWKDTYGNELNRYRRLRPL